MQPYEQRSSPWRRQLSRAETSRCESRVLARRGRTAEHVHWTHRPSAAARPVRPPCLRRGPLTAETQAKQRTPHRGNRADDSAATASANAALPTPPGPVNVVNGTDATVSATSTISRSLPTNRRDRTTVILRTHPSDFRTPASRWISPTLGADRRVRWPHMRPSLLQRIRRRRHVLARGRRGPRRQRGPRHDRRLQDRRRTARQPGMVIWFFELILVVPRRRFSTSRTRVKVLPPRVCAVSM